MHALLVGAAASWLAFGTLNQRKVETAHPSEPQTTSAVFDVELPKVLLGELTTARPPDPSGIPPEANAGNTVPRPDTGTAGAGGDATVDERAVNLSDGDERMRLSPDLLSRLDRDQLQRLLVARIRQSWEDRRATTHPMELTFLASGPGKLEQRRLLASDPSRGAMSAPGAGVLGSDLGTPDPGRGDDPETAVGGARLGGSAAGAGAGVAHGKPGPDHRASALVATGRPDVTQGPVALNANDKGRPKDDVDTQQEVATTVRSLVHASTAGGAVGSGRGGTGGGGDPGAGGTQGAGSRSGPLGNGEGDTFDVNTSDPRLVPYFRQIQAKIRPLWANAFPTEAVVELKQGTVILAFDISSSGAVTVQWPPIRPSGIDEFDKNCANALRRASPLPPIPPELGRSHLRIVMPFVVKNPIIK